MTVLRSIFAAPAVLMLALSAAVGCGPAEAPRNTAPSRSAHALYFTIDQGSHASLDCNACHADGSTFRSYSCTGCHDHDAPSSDSAHRDLTAAYTYSPTSCYQCHTAGTSLLFKHTPYFPIRAGDKHAGTPCIQCHTNINVRTTQDCLTCHPAVPVDGQHSDVGGYARNSVSCEGCHADSQVNRVADHLPFTILAPSKHDLQPCAGCHSTQRVDKPFGIDFTVFTCLDCHPQATLAPTHTPLPGYKYDTPTCVQAGCHQQGQKLK